jgi:hypothetical protein
MKLKFAAARYAAAVPSSSHFLFVSFPYQLRPNIDLGSQGAVYRAHICDLQKALTLLSVEWPDQLNPSLDLIDQSILGFTVLTIGGVDLMVTKPNNYMLKRPILSIRIHPQVIEVQDPNAIARSS